MNLRKKLIKIIDCVYWVCLILNWFFKGCAEVCSAISGLLKEFDSEDE